MKHSLKRTKILATVGPSTSSYEKIEQLAMAGVNGFRLNFSHGDYNERDDQIKWIRQASQKIERPVAIVQDLQGPKIRLGLLTNDVKVVKGDVVTLSYGAVHDGAMLIPIQYNLAEKVKLGQAIYIFDGKIRTTVIEIASDTAVKVEVENNGIMMSRKGINLPDTDFGGDIITAKDLRDIEYGSTRDIDFVALSFVQSADDINNLRQILVSLGSDAQIIAKIETKAAIMDDALEDIVNASDGVMVARGDLAVEAGPEIIPVVQRKIIAMCRKHGKLSIVATQMMASMVDSSEPTRAEVGDVANAVILGADSVMLSEETANGNYPIESVKAMKKVILYTQQNIPVDPILDVIIQGSLNLDAIASATVQLAEQMKAVAIIAKTKTGTTACAIAAYRPNLPIISVTSNPRTAQQLSLCYANRSYIRPDGRGVAYSLGVELKQENYFKPDEDGLTRVAIVSGSNPGMPGTTDTIRMRVLE